jgi:hypothetical protein
MDKREFRKSTKLELEKRLSASVEKIIKDHLNYTMFVDWFIEEYDMSKHNAYKEWVKCWNIIKSRFALETDQLINKQIYELYDLYKETRETGDFGTSRKLLEDIRKIQGIEQPEKLNIKHEGIIKVSFGDEEN